MAHPTSSTCGRQPWCAHFKFSRGTKSFLIPAWILLTFSRWQASNIKVAKAPVCSSTGGEEFIVRFNSSWQMCRRSSCWRFNFFPGVISPRFRHRWINLAWMLTAHNAQWNNLSRKRDFFLGFGMLYLQAHRFSRKITLIVLQFFVNLIAWR